MDLSEKILTLRKSNGLTQEQLAEQLNVSIGIYLLAFAAYIIGHIYFQIWNPSVFFAEFMIATDIGWLRP